MREFTIKRPRGGLPDSEGAARFKEWVRAAGMTLGRAAAVMGIDGPKLSKILRGQREPNFEELAKLATAVNVPLLEILRVFGMDYAEPWEFEHLVVGSLASNDEITLDFLDGGGIERIKTEFMGYIGRIVQIQSDAFAPRYKNKEYIGFSENDGVEYEYGERIYGEEAIVQTTDCVTFLKRIERGSEPGRYTLISLNPENAPMLNVSLLWATKIDFHLPGHLNHSAALHWPHGEPKLPAGATPKRMWQRITYTDDEMAAGEHMRMLGFFDARYEADGQPLNAAIFRHLGDRGVFYLTPAAHWICSGQLPLENPAKRPGQSIVTTAPNPATVVFIAGDPEALKRLKTGNLR